MFSFYFFFKLASDSLRDLRQRDYTIGVFSADGLGICLLMLLPIAIWIGRWSKRLQRLGLTLSVIAWLMALLFSAFSADC